MSNHVKPKQNLAKTRWTKMTWMTLRGMHRGAIWLSLLQRSGCAMRSMMIIDDLWCDSTANSRGPLTDTLCHKLCGMRLQQWTRRLAKQTRQACRCNGNPLLLPSSLLTASVSWMLLTTSYYNISMMRLLTKSSLQILPTKQRFVKVCTSEKIWKERHVLLINFFCYLLLTSQAYSCVSGFKCGTQSSKFRATWFFESLVLVVMRFQPMAHICVAQSSRCLHKYFPFGFPPKPIASNDQTASTVRQIYLQDWNILKYSHIYSRTCLNF